MQIHELLRIREDFNEKKILLCFNGPISRSLIEEIGTALRKYLQEDQATPSVSMDVFGVYIELTQNIRHYAHKAGYGDVQGAGTVIVARHDDQHYSVLAGNVIEREDAVPLMEKVSELAAMDKSELRRAYKQRLREPRTDNAASGAGLGLIDVARKSHQPLISHMIETPDGKAFFSLLAIV